MTASRVANRLGFRLLFRHCSGVDTLQSRLNIRISAKGERRISTVVSQFWGGGEKVSILGDYFTSSRLGDSSLQFRLLGSVIRSNLKLASKSAVTEKRRFFRTDSPSDVDASESLEDGREASPETDLSSIGKGTASLAVKEYFRDVKGVSEGDAEFICRNCPSFAAKLGKFVSTSLQERKGESADSISSKVYVELFLEKEGDTVTFFGGNLFDCQCLKYIMIVTGCQWLS